MKLRIAECSWVYFFERVPQGSRKGPFVCLSSYHILSMNGDPFRKLFEDAFIFFSAIFDMFAYISHACLENFSRRKIFHWRWNSGSEIFNRVFLTFN